jgi:hypothetical protein
MPSHKPECINLHQKSHKMVIYASILLNMIMFQPNPQNVINLHGYH